MRLKEIRGLPVIDPTAARKVGTVVDYQVDPVVGRIAALDITPVTGGEGERILAQRIRRVGSSAVILTARGGSMPSEPLEILDRWLDTSTTIGLEVMGDDGNRIGHLVDATFNQDSLEVEAYLLRASFRERLIGRRGRIQPDKVHACSRELMMVVTGKVKAVELAPEETHSMEMPLPLKAADRVAAPSYEPVPDGKPVGAPR
ncbi:MAG: PRC-barrel domain-containing protein [Chloroflexi bacterium]|nr:PRC-barrel domain-containing protein [Chloroflexota bacterium]MBV9893009.1 PRC-barrel domain-containing protein [Chloroflexota bacterium]